MTNKNIKGRRAAVSALAVTTSLSLLAPAGVQAKEPGTPKEEVVYVNLNNDGSVDDIHVVNIFRMESAGTIRDYGSYENVRNMTTEDPIDYSDDTVTIDTGAGDLYYEGSLNTKQIPWDIDIHYYLDGKELSAEELAGKSGKLKITLSVRENPAGSDDFFDSCALQASFTLDTKKCRNISAEDATIANVGSDKQMTYTILPGNDADITITADVEDFEMDAASINGVSLSMDIDMDESELTDKIDELMDAISQINDGASELNDGALELNTGAKSLDLGVKRIQMALGKVDAQSDNLTSASSQMKTALSALQSGLTSAAPTTEDITRLTTASTDLKKGIDDLTDGLTELNGQVSYDSYCAVMQRQGVNVNTVKTQNTNTAASIDATIGQLNNTLQTLQSTLDQMDPNVPGQSSQIAEIETQISQLQGQINELSGISTLLKANNGCISGTEAYLGGVNQKIGEALDGAKTLQTNYAEFDKQIQSLAGKLGNLPLSEIQKLVDAYAELDAGIRSYTDGVSQILTGSKEAASGSGELLSGTKALSDGTSTLADGTSELYDETSTMDTELTEKIDELKDSITGGDTDTVSFVSEDNTAESVQFVIQTKAIKVDEPEKAEEKTKEKTGFFQKLKALF